MCAELDELLRSKYGRTLRKDYPTKEEEEEGRSETEDSPAKEEDDDGPEQRAKLQQVMKTFRHLWGGVGTNDTDNDMNICFDIICLLCEHYERCDDESRWQELYSLYNLWQGNAGGIMGGIFTGAMMMVGDMEVSEFHHRKLLFPLLRGEEIPQDEWDARVDYCLRILKERDGNCIFGDLPNAESDRDYYTLEGFRTKFIPLAYRRGAEADGGGFLKFISSKRGETGSRAK